SSSSESVKTKFLLFKNPSNFFTFLTSFTIAFPKHVIGSHVTVGIGGGVGERIGGGGDVDVGIGVGVGIGGGVGEGIGGGGDIGWV
ncbi:hypothetical protein Tco_0495526, partial [Tanacetum coccineum]